MFGICVVAHSARSGQAKSLGVRVGADAVCVDAGQLGCDGNHDRAHQLLVGLGEPWSVVLEDDSVPVEGFRDQLGCALADAPTDVVSLYLGRLRPPQFQRAIGAAVAAADGCGADWIVSDRMYHGVGYAIRTELVESLMSFELSVPVDERISAWAMAGGRDVGYCWPSLVDHADWPSVIGRHRDGARRPPGRVAWRCGGHDGWGGGVVRVAG